MSPSDNLPAVRANSLPSEGGYVPAVVGQTADAPVRGVRIIRLRLQGIEIDYEVDFRDTGEGFRPLSIIAGAFSTGKSSTLQFIDYCLGAKSHPQHPEILRRVRSALLEVELSGQRFVIERAVGEPSQQAYVRSGKLGETGDFKTERRPIRPPGDPSSLSSFLLSYCGLEGVELKEAPTKEESATDPLSFRDLMWLAYLPNERLDDKNLLFESSPMRFLKLGQVFNVIFGCHDDKAIELGARVKELEIRLARSRHEADSAQRIVDEQEFGSRGTLEVQHDLALAAIEAVDTSLQRLDGNIRAASNFAEGLRQRHQNAAQAADGASSMLRDRETQIKRLMPLRAQYAADVSKLTMLLEAHRIFDPLRVRVCPACLTSFSADHEIEAGHCTLCQSEIGSNEVEALAGDSHASAQTSSGENRDRADAFISGTSPAFDISPELRATKARLAEITTYLEQLESEVPELQSQLQSARKVQTELANAVDDATYKSISPFLSERDDLLRQRERSAADIERIATGIRFYDSVDRRLLDAQRLETALQSARAELQSSAPPVSRSSVITLVSQRFSEILDTWKYPKLEQAFINTNLRPYMRGLPYSDASSGGRTLISLAWFLAVFEIAWETGSNHPGFLMIDSPQKNLGHGGELDQAFADSVAVSEIYNHLRSWLAGAGAGAQVIIVDNSPPATVDDDVVVRFSGRAENPPYGLVTDETQ